MKRPPFRTRSRNARLVGCLAALTVMGGQSPLAAAGVNPNQAKPRPSNAPAVTAASVAEDIAKVEKVVEAIRKLDEAQIGAFRASTLKQGESMDTNPNQWVVRQFNGHTRKWVTALSGAKQSLKEGRLETATLHAFLQANNEYEDIFRYVQASQLGKKPTAWDTPHLAYQVQLLRLCGGLLGKRVPDPITLEFLQIRTVGKKPEAK